MENGFRPVEYRDGKLVILDQTLLPGQEKYIELHNREELIDSIKRLAVRGAPAIGVCAGYGLLVSVREHGPETGDDLLRFAEEDAEAIGKARPTAVNLQWAVRRCVSELRTFAEAAFAAFSDQAAVQAGLTRLLETAAAIDRENREACRKMGEFGLGLLKPGMGILTHCNAGALATVDYGTCLAPIYLGQDQGYGFHVFADETRPLLQGARLTSWELSRAGVDVTLICDNMANQVMKNGWIDAVVVGCDRMAANGDGANKIGTSGVAVLAKEHRIPFYMFVPTSTIDLDASTGDDIPIELRDGEEIRSMWYERPMAPAEAKTYDPAFDVTPAEYITAVVTEKGVVRPPYSENLRRIMEMD